MNVPHGPPATTQPRTDRAAGKALAGERIAAMRARTRKIRIRVASGATALFVAAFGGIYAQMATGHDPALSAEPLVKRLVETACDVWQRHRRLERGEYRDRGLELKRSRHERLDGSTTTSTEAANRRRHVERQRIHVEQRRIVRDDVAVLREPK